jgi:hypothetical protein
VDADQRHALELGVPLDDLVRDARQRALDVFRIEDSLRFGGLRARGVACDAVIRTLGLCPGVRRN